MNFKHGMKHTELYSRWCSMKARCKETTTPNAKRYFERNITYDAKWEKFENFYADMSEGFASDREIDRKDNNLGYFKENCHWVSKQANVRNRSNTVYVQVNGKPRILAEVCEEKGLRYKTVWQRIFSYGETDEERIFSLKRLKPENLLDNFPGLR